MIDELARAWEQATIAHKLHEEEAERLEAATDAAHKLVWGRESDSLDAETHGRHRDALRECEQAESAHTRQRYSRHQEWEETIGRLTNEMLQKHGCPASLSPGPGLVFRYQILRNVKDFPQTYFVYCEGYINHPLATPEQGGRTHWGQPFTVSAAQTQLTVTYAAMLGRKLIEKIFDAAVGLYHREPEPIAPEALLLPDRDFRNF